MCYALNYIPLSDSRMLFHNRLDNDVITIEKSYSYPYHGQIGKARAKVQVRHRNLYFKGSADGWGCGTQDYFGDITEMIADEAGLTREERYSGRFDDSWKLWER